MFSTGFSWCRLILSYNQIQARMGVGERVTMDIQPSLEQILEVEKWAMKELEIERQDSMWAVQMAITFRHYGYYEQAIERSTVARDLDASNWRAPFCLAQTHALQNEYKPALEVLGEVIDMFRKDTALMNEWRTVFYDQVLYRFAEWNVELSEYEVAREAYMEIYKEDPDDYQPMVRIILILEAQEEYGQILDLLQLMGTETNSEGLTRVVAMIHQYADSKMYHDTVTKAGRAVGQLETIKETYQIAVEAAKSSDSRLTSLTALRYWYAMSLYYDYSDPAVHEEAITLWEQNVATIPRISNSTIKNVRWSTIAKLASVYLQEAREAGFDTPAAETYRSKLVFLSSSNSVGAEDDFLQNVDSKLMLARFYFFTGNKEKAVEAIKGHIKLALDILSDDDDGNDWQGFKRLSLCLNHIDDDINALAAWSLLGPVVSEPSEDEAKEEESVAPEAGEDDGETGGEGDTQEEDKSVDGDSIQIDESTESEADSQTETGSEAALESENGSDHNVDTPEEETTEVAPSSPASSVSGEQATAQGNIGFSCDGSCGHEWSYADDLHVCRDCLDVQFDGKCYEKLKAGKLEQKVCNKNHTFLHVPPWDPEAASAVPERHVRVGEEVIPIPEWIDRIRKLYGFS